jgi:hypothetical protein
LRRQERYEAWLHREEDNMKAERQALQPIAQRRVQQRETELREWAAEEEWARWLHCSHLPDARVESDLNDYLTDWEKDQSKLTVEKAVTESGAP